MADDGAEIIELGSPVERLARPIGCGDDLRWIAGTVLPKVNTKVDTRSRVSRRRSPRVPKTRRP